MRIVFYTIVIVCTFLFWTTQYHNIQRVKAQAPQQPQTQPYVEEKSKEPQVKNQLPPELTDKEKYTIRTAEFEKLVSERALMDADHKLQVAIAQTYVNHKLTIEEYSLCAGPGEGVCATAPRDDIVYRKNPTPPEKEKK
jgi:hypothetical protein